MKLLEVKNNLVKLECGSPENLFLGKFIAIMGDEKSYVAQIINLKSDDLSTFVVAKLLFTYTEEGIVDNYDGSIPSLSSGTNFLPSKELLDLLPVESPVKIGNLAQENSMLTVDSSIFERHFTVFSEHNYEKETFISNCVRQLFWLKEKSVIIDTSNMFEDYPKLTLGQDFKLPLNAQTIDYIFEYELAEVESTTKAVIQEIFYAVSQYINSLEEKFIPIDNFIEVVANQYKETQMPELALLKNKLLKYKDANVFANKLEEYTVLTDKLNERNTAIIDLKDFNGQLQKNVISYIFDILEKFDKYVYYFVPVDDDNSDKKLLKKFLSNSHVFTTVLASHSYKYSSELKENAENILFFAPVTMQHDFAAYNTFLNKLNLSEGILYGKLTQGVPFITDISDLDLDLTKDDVFGEKQPFIPTIDEYKDNLSEMEPILPESDNVPNIEKEEQYTQHVQNDNIEEVADLETYENIEDISKSNSENLNNHENEEENQEENYINNEEYVENNETDSLETEENIEDDISEDETDDNSNIIEPVENLMSDEYENDADITNLEEFDSIIDEADSTNLTEDDLDFIENNAQEEPEVYLNPVEKDEDEYGELETYTQATIEDEDEQQLVPVFSTNEEASDGIDDLDFAQGDTVIHSRYGTGVIEKIIKYGNKTLCSITFENVGRRLLDPSVSELEKVG